MALDAACEHVLADGSVAKYRQRSAYVAAYVLDRANGFCGVCGRPAPFRRPDGGAYLEPHHVIRLSDDDPDHPSMVTAACPACHRRVHYGEDGQATNNRLKAHVPAVEQAIADGRFIIVTAAAIRNDDGRVLIVQKGGHGTIAGKWESPCGKAELGETLEGCLKRATLEELGDSPCPRPFSLGVKAAVRREMMPNLRVAGHHRTCRKTVRFSLRPAGKPRGSSRSSEMGGRFAVRRALMAVFDGPLPGNHILPAPLAACSLDANYLEKEAPQPATFGEVCACETVGFPGRLCKRPAAKPYGRQLSRGRQGHWAPRRH